MLTLVGLYAEETFSSCDLVTCGASSPQPSPSAPCVAEGCARERPPNGLKPPEPPTLLGMKTGLDATGGAGPLDWVVAAPPLYFEPDESATFWTMLSGVRSLSDRAVIWTW